VARSLAALRHDGQPGLQPQEHGHLTGLCPGGWVTPPKEGACCRPSMSATNAAARCGRARRPPALLPGDQRLHRLQRDAAGALPDLCAAALLLPGVPQPDLQQREQPQLLRHVHRCALAPACGSRPRSRWCLIAGLRKQALLQVLASLCDFLQRCLILSVVAVPRGEASGSHLLPLPCMRPPWRPRRARRRARSASRGAPRRHVREQGGAELPGDRR
jgi:hypothetical protein